MRRVVVLAAVVGLVLAGVLASPESSERGVLDSAGLRLDAAAAAGSNRAGVIIDDGNSVRRVCIHFDGTLTGVEALQRAASATVAPFGGLGVAVCGINGVGCPGDNSCLTCQQPKFWSYSRAPSGSTSFGVASSGASASMVRDGDVEGWRWGGGKPAHVSAASICGESPPPPPVEPSPPPLSSGGGGGGGAAPNAPGSGGGSGTGATGGSSSASTAPSVKGEQATNDKDAESEEAAAATASSTAMSEETSDADSSASGDTDSSADALGGSQGATSDASSAGSIVGLLVLGAVLVGGAVAFVVLRRRART